MHGRFIGWIASVFIAISGQAFGQDVNPEIANCEELRDDATVTQAELCKAHIGCAFVFKIQKVCAKAKGFLNRLKDTLSGRTQVTSDDVFEAHSPALQPNPQLTGNVSAARNAVKDAARDRPLDKEVLKAGSGARVYYEGTKVGGGFTGAGVYINENGAMGRGQMKSNQLDGAAQIVTAEGRIWAGAFREGKGQGPIAMQSTDGSIVYTGTQVNGVFRGWVEATRADGYTQKNFMDDQGRATYGQWTPPGQVAVAPQIPSAPVAQPAPVAPAPRPDPVAAIDTRISEQRASCEAADGGCRRVCLGVGAVSIFSALRGVDTTSQVTECTNRCDSQKATCDGKVAALESEKQALLNPGAPVVASPVSFAPGRTGLPFDECRRQENASDIGNKLRGLPASNTNLQTRGIIVASDFMIATYRQCLPDQRAQQVVDQYTRTRADSLRTCRQVSSFDNCLQSPF